MVRIGTFFYTLFLRLLLIVGMSIIAVPLLISLLLPGLLVDNWLFGQITRFFYWFCIKLSFLPITYRGLDNVPDQPVVIIANHQSSFDIPLVGYALAKRLHIWLAWKQLAQSWLLRFILPRNAILVDPSTPITGMRSLVEAIGILRDKPWDLIIFPEGGRYTDGNLRKFFGGFCTLARKLNRPVVPIHICGVNTVYPPNTFWIYYAPITVYIGKPITINPDETDEQFIDRVYNWFIQSKD